MMATLPQDDHQLPQPQRLAALRLFESMPPQTRAVFDRLTHLTARILNVPIAMIMLVETDRQRLISQIGLGEPWAKRTVLPLDHSFCQQVVTSQQPVIIDDAQAHPRLRATPAVRDLGMTAYAGWPIRLHDGSVIGALAAADRQPRQWTDDDRMLLEDLCHSVVTEMELRLELSQHRAADAALRASVDQLKILRRIDAELAESLNLDSVLAVAMDVALRVSRADDAAIALLKDDEVEIVASAGLYPLGMRLAADTGIVGRVLRTGQAELVDDVSTDPDYFVKVPTTVAQMTIPLSYRERMIGVLSMETGRPGRFTAEGLEFLMLVAGRIAVAIDNAQLYHLLNEQYRSLQDLFDRVKELEQTKTDMIRIAAHDLRNPLGMVIGYGELLAEMGDNLTAAQTDFVQSILRGGRKMQKIITDILSLERIEARSSPASHVIADFAALVRTAFHDCAQSAERKGLSCSLIIETEPLPVAMEEVEMREAIDNLIINAIKYTPTGGQVRVSVLESQYSARFLVEDNGAGIPADQQERLFQPFYRPQTEATAKVEGTGLGLHLVKKIVQRHGGTIIFRSDEGVGSTFGFTLPKV